MTLAANSAAEVLYRDDLVAAVLDRNPSLEAARYAWEAAAARPGQVSLDYPTISYGIAPLSIGSSQVDFGETAELAQALPWPGKLRGRREAAGHDAEARFRDFEEAKIQIALRASDLFDDYYLVARALEINAEHVRLLEELKRAATGQYAAGRLSQQDPLKAEVELAHLAHRDVVLRSEQRVIVARLNALLHRRPAEPLPPPPREMTPTALAHHVAQLGDPGAEHLEDLAVATRPEIAAADADVRARRADVSVADLEGYPDLGIMGSYSSMWAEEEHRWMTGLSLSVPLWRERIRAAQAESAARLKVAERRRLALEDEVRSAVRLTYERAVEAHHVAALFLNRLLPAARDQIRAARAGLEVGRSSFLELVDAERNLRDVELGYEEAVTDIDRQLNQLARQIGCLPAELPDFVTVADKEREH